MGQTLYTIGYEQTDPETFVRKLRAACVQMVVDIRELPQSRIPGFSKTVLAAQLRRRGIEYLHVPELGSPRALRHGLRETGDFMAFTRGYLLYLKQRREHIHLLKDLAYRQTCCLLCFEKNYDVCHRKFVAHEIKAIGRNGLVIVHL